MSDARPRPPRVGALYDGHRVAKGTAATGDFTYVVLEPEPLDTKPKDRRGEKRTRTRLRDGVVDKRRVLVDCRIRDRSKFGARLQLDGDQRLPMIFELTDPATRIRFIATLAWQEGREAGVKLKPIA